MEAKKHKILVVEDNADELQLLKMILEPEGYEVATATDGKKGLEAVKSNRPDLIVLDVMMPELDGFALCELLKNNPEFKKIPIVLLTGVAEHVRDSHYPLNGVMRANAQEYLEKPVKPEELLETLRQLVGSTNQ